MASWKGHMGGATVFFVAPAVAAVTLGAGGFVLNPPGGACGAGPRNGTEGSRPEQQTQALRVGWSVLLFSAAIFGGLLPDVDTASVGRRFTFGRRPNVSRRGALLLVMYLFSNLRPLP